VPAARTATVQYQPSAHDFRVIIRVGVGTDRRQVYSTTADSFDGVKGVLADWKIPGLSHATVIPAAG